MKPGPIRGDAAILGRVEEGLNILHVNSSPDLDASLSRRLSARIVDRILARHPMASVTVRDVGRDPPRPADADVVAGLRSTGLTALTDRQLQEKAISERMVAELLRADIVVIGAPMHNFTITAQLKAWVDRICQAGVTFRYTPDGPVGLVADKTAIIAAVRGGNYSCSEYAHRDFQIPYLRKILHFIGLSDVRLILAEGVNISADHRTQAIDEAERAIDALCPAFDVGPGARRSNPAQLIQGKSESCQGLSGDG